MEQRHPPRGRELTGNTSEQMPSEILDMLFRKRLESVALQKVEYAHPVQLGHQARVIAVVQVFVEVHTFAVLSAVQSEVRHVIADLLHIIWVMLPQCLQYSNLDLAGVAVLLHRSYNLDGDFPPRLNVSCFDDFAKGTLS
jgi:hypothetical protein